MKTDKLLIGVVALVGGILVGKNWDKIKKFVVLNIAKIKMQPVYEESAKDNKSIKTEVASIFCSQCQTKLKSTAEFCHKCGKEQ